MLPRPSGDNPPDGLISDCVHLRKLGLFNAFIGEPPYVSYLFFCELVTTVVLALSNLRVFSCSVLISASWSVNSFISEIVHIIRMGTAEKMGWTHAGFVVARMTNFMSFWNFTNKKPIRKTACAILSFFNPHHSVAVAFSSNPNPTFSKLRCVVLNLTVLIDLFIETRKNDLIWFRNFNRFHP